MNIAFTNDGSFGESDVNTPITITGNFNGAYYTKLSPLVVGKIIDVTPQLVFAEIEEQYLQELTMRNGTANWMNIF